MNKELEQLFAAVAFAEANEHETALQLMMETKSNRVFNRVKNVFNKFRNTVDNYQEAITFAEANSYDLIKDPICEEIEASKLLVIGHHGKFSDEIINYAVDMAKRMCYDIVALNTAPFSCDTMNLFTREQKKLCDDFTKLAKENCVEFERMALSNGIEFKHIIMFDDSQKAQENFFRNEKDIAFVISSNVEDRNTNVQRESLQNRVYVYSII